MGLLSECRRLAAAVHGIGWQVVWCPSTYIGRRITGPIRGKF